MCGLTLGKHMRCVRRGRTRSVNTGWEQPVRHACLRKRPGGQGWRRADSEQRLELVVGWGPWQGVGELRARK